MVRWWYGVMAVWRVSMTRCRYHGPPGTARQRPLRELEGPLIHDLLRRAGLLALGRVARDADIGAAEVRIDAVTGQLDAALGEALVIVVADGLRRSGHNVEQLQDAAVAVHVGEVHVDRVVDRAGRVRRRDVVQKQTARRVILSVRRVRANS
eukprot:scaffold286_cov247-Pinguiococcus_pyrenoidosus.AAC.17